MLDIRQAIVYIDIEVKLHMLLTKEKQDLTYLSWSVYRNSSGTVGSFLKAYSELGGTKTYAGGCGAARAGNSRNKGSGH